MSKKTVLANLISPQPPLHSTARNSKVAQVQAAYDKAYGSGVEIFDVDDLATGDYTTALVGTSTIPKSLKYQLTHPNNPGVNAVIHLAMPVNTPLDAKGTIDVRHSLVPR